MGIFILDSLDEIMTCHLLGYRLSENAEKIVAKLTSTKAELKNEWFSAWQNSKQQVKDSLVSEEEQLWPSLN